MNKVRQALRSRRRRRHSAIGYHYDAIGHLIKVAPVNPERLPRRCTLKTPIEAPAGYVEVFDGESWGIESIYLAEMAIADHYDRTRLLGVPWALGRAFQFLKEHYANR